MHTFFFRKFFESVSALLLYCNTFSSAMNASNCRTSFVLFLRKTIKYGSGMIEVPHNALSCHIEFRKTKLEEMASQKPHVLQVVTHGNSSAVGCFRGEGFSLFQWNKNGHISSVFYRMHRILIRRYRIVSISN